MPEVALAKRSHNDMAVRLHQFPNMSQIQRVKPIPKKYFSGYLGR
jgi:hypothetical protein